jgi:hypothetical protein
MRGEFGGPRGWKVTRLNAETYKGDAEKPRGIGRRVACELAKRVGFLFAAGASDLVSMARSLAAIGSSAPDQDPLRGARPDESRCQIGTHCQRSWQLLERGRRWRRRGAARLSVARTFRYTHAYRRHCARARARATQPSEAARAPARLMRANGRVYLRASVPALHTSLHTSCHGDTLTRTSYLPSASRQNPCERAR